MRGPWGQLGTRSPARCAGCSFLACVCTSNLQLRGSWTWLCLLCNSHLESNTQGGPEGWRCCRKRHLAHGFDPRRSQTPCQTPSFCLAFCLGSFFSWKLPFPAILQRAKACCSPPFAAAPPSCAGFCVFLVKFSRQNPRGLLLLEPCWAGSGLGQLGAEPLVLVASSALAKAQPDPLSTSTSAWPAWGERGSQMWVIPAG